MKDMGFPLDDRIKMFMRDHICSVLMIPNEPETPQGKEICIRQILIEKGLSHINRFDVAVGIETKKLKLEKMPNYVFPKKDIICNGQLTKANMYGEQDIPIVEQAIKNCLLKRDLQRDVPRYQTNKSIARIVNSV